MLYPLGSVQLLLQDLRALLLDLQGGAPQAGQVVLLPLPAIGPLLSQRHRHSLPCACAAWACPRLRLWLQIYQPFVVNRRDSILEKPGIDNYAMHTP